MKKAVSILLALTLLFACLPAFAEDEEVLKVTVNGTAVYFADALPYDSDGTVMAAISPIAEAMGLNYSWYPTLEKAVLSDNKLRVELVAGQISVKLSGSTFIADSPLSLDEWDRLYASVATIQRLAQYFGWEPTVYGNALRLRRDGGFAVFVNGARLSFNDFAPVVRNGEDYIPLQAAAQAMGLDFDWSRERLSAELVQEETGRRMNINISDGFANGATSQTEGALYEDNRLFVSAEKLISIAEYFGGTGSYNLYQNGMAFSVGQPCAVTVNGILVVFPDVQPADGGGLLIPARPVFEAMGLKFVWDREGEKAEIVKTARKKAILTPGVPELGEVNARSEKTATLDRAPEFMDNRLMISSQTLARAADFFDMDITVSGGLIEVTDPEAEAYTPVREAEPEEPREQGIRVELDGREISFPDVKPFSQGGRTLVPIRAVAEEMGLDVYWDGGDGVEIYDGGDYLEMTLGSDVLTGRRGGVKVESRLDVPAMSYQGRTCIPIRAVMEFFGAAVRWNGEASLVSIASSRESRESSVREVGSKEDFGVELGFTINAPLTGSDVSFSIVNGNTARVAYNSGGAAFVFNASSESGGAALKSSDFDGPVISQKALVNGVETQIYSGSTVFSTKAAYWKIGSYSFSLETEDAVSSSFLTLAEAAARTFVIVKEVEPENNGIKFSPNMSAVTVDGSSFFTDLGISMTVPEGAENMSFKIYDGVIAEITFTFEDYDYVLRAAVNGGDLWDMGDGASFTAENFQVSGLYGMGIAMVTINLFPDVGRAASWSWGDVKFFLSCHDADIPSAVFRQVCEDCGEMSSKTLTLGL